MSWNIKKVVHPAEYDTEMFCAKFACNAHQIEIKCIGVGEVSVRIEGGLDLGKRSVVSSQLHLIDDKYVTRVHLVLRIENELFGADCSCSMRPRTQRATKQQGIR
jgi:hypothetical protein